jgi:hypothetical protein
VQKDLAEFENLSAEAGEFVFDTIDIGMESAAIGDGDFTPFVTLMVPDTGIVVCRMDVAQGEVTGEEGVELCRDHLRSVDPSSVRSVAILWDGYLTLDDTRTEAVFVEAYELGRPVGVLMAQRYERWANELNRLGNPVLLSHEPDPLVPPRRAPRDAAIARIQALADRRNR